MVKIKTEVLIFLIVFDLLFQMQAKSRQSISKKGRNTLVDLIWQFSEIGCYDLFAYRLTRFSLHLKEQVKYYQKISTSVILTIEKFVQLLGGWSLSY